MSELNQFNKVPIILGKTQNASETVLFKSTLQVKETLLYL